MKKKPHRHAALKETTAPLQIGQAARLEAPPPRINVRAAKDRLSRLLRDAAAGNEVIITSDGVPKARLVPYRAARKQFRVDWKLLRSMRVTAAGRSADDLVREDRDARP